MYHVLVFWKQCHYQKHCPHLGCQNHSTLRFNPPHHQKYRPWIHWSPWRHCAPWRHCGPWRHRERCSFSFFSLASYCSTNHDVPNRSSNIDHCSTKLCGSLHTSTTRCSLCPISSKFEPSFHVFSWISYPRPYQFRHSSQRHFPLYCC